ncbi:DUF2188 domain-containing protein [Caenispirillum bisanense]|uniref:DUF2188 domain-containing protein n=1 Tax=Caenispirillum bisanense TaxID=414052 RepID=UPI0031D4C1ED
MSAVSAHAAPAAVAAGCRTPVFHVVREPDGGDEAIAWAVRREGDPRTHRFPDRPAAADFARSQGRAAGGYRLFMELRDGRMMCEMLNVAG